MTGTALATRGSKALSVEGVVDYKPNAVQQRVMDLLTKPESMAVLAPLIPKDVDRQEVAIEVYRAVTKNPAILDCTETSIIMAVADCVQVGLTIGKTIHLVPVRPERGAKQELQAWTDYKGDIELVMRSGAAKLVYAYPVFEKDDFAPHLGDNPHIHHVPAWREPPGKMVGAYAVAFINNTIKKVAWMRLDQIEKIRAKSRQWSPDRVKECPDWYACKTAIHRLCKDLPKNPALAKVLARFEREDVEDHGSPIDSVEGTLAYDEPTEHTDAGELSNTKAIAATSSAATESQATESQADTTTSPSAAPPASEAPAPPAAPTRDLAWARAFAYPMKRSPHHGKPIAEFSYDQLQEIETSILNARKTTGDDTKYDELFAAVRLVMESLEEPTQSTLALDEEDDLLAASPVKPSAAGSGATPEDATKLRPGKIEDALDKPATPAPAPTAAAPTSSTSVISLVEISREAATQLKDPKLTADEKAQYKARFDKATTVEAMQQLVDDLREFLQAPF
jgi:phage RecT family recombinase